MNAKSLEISLVFEGCGRTGNTILCLIDLLPPLLFQAIKILIFDYPSGASGSQSRTRNLS